jgi:glucose-1-phosphate cytidylyltransferase
MKYYAAWGRKEFVLCLGHKSQMIKDFFINYDTRLQDCTITLGAAKGIEYHSQHEEIDWIVTLAETGLESLTGTRLRLVKKYLADQDDFMLTYGDGVGDVNLDALLEFHRAHGKIMTVTGVRPPGRFGELVCDAAGQVTEFNEKPQASVGQISGGFFVCRRDIFNYLDPQANQMLEVEPMRQLVRDGQ